MSSYALFARLSTLEGDSGDLQATVDALSAGKQDAITNAPVLDGQAIKVGSFFEQDRHQGLHPHGGDQW